jgi:hypothetical protein
MATESDLRIGGRFRFVKGLGGAIFLLDPTEVGSQCLWLFYFGQF